MNNWLSILIDKATSQGYKSNILRPIISIVAVIFAASIYYCYQNAFLLAFISLCMAILFAILFIVTFIYCMLKKPDLLRSERYNLQMKAMEQNMSSSGDSSEKKVYKVIGKKENTGYVFYAGGKENRRGDRS